MRRELMLFGLDVIIVAPGQVATPIWDKAEAEDYGRYERTQYASILKRFSEFFVAQGRKGLTAESIGEVVLDALTSKKPRFRYDPIPQRFKNWTLPTMLPKRVLDGIIAKRLGFRDLHQGPKFALTQSGRTARLPYPSRNPRFIAIVTACVLSFAPSFAQNVLHVTLDCRL